MGERLLTAPIAGVGAEAKYFLIAFICRLADTEGMDMSVKALARSLAVTPGAASRARKALIEHQCLECHKAPTGGRPTLGLKVGRGLASKLGDLSTSASHHGPVLRHLFSGAIYRDYEANRTPISSNELLRPQLRLLLATLFAHANELGLVDNLGLAQLRQLLGEGEEKVDRWLKELLQLGFIRRKIAGLSDSLYADTKVTSSYILNLNHPGLASAGCSSPVVAFYGEAMRSEESRHGFAERFARVQGAFQGLGRTYEMLVWKIYQGVSLLLSNHWSVLGESVRLPQIDGLEKIMTESLHASGKDDSSLEVMVADMCWWAFHLASRVKNRIAGDSAFASLVGRRVLAFPAKNRDTDDSMTLVFAQESWGDGPECIVSLSGTKGHVEIWTKESDLSREQLSKHGLVSFEMESTTG
ncbi:hypothetical protein L4O78_002551 [Pseudomonas aeruginosa]|jgi:hypothetical protein|nr:MULTISPECIES: hypothetical protein [Pseudomonas]EIU2894299.1 hypothetical protein [Pseudomonas aeruginosa]EIU2920520.1 hypothetical protein [Pseudomonas aeruginosa]EJN6722200.1 hypothetical protein [Pseudomonas aeruginosa]EKU2414569.1 hypothetical protein [Pseudomonas aeruginosa]EKU3896672.1 hypothetical protein [Pseudomonas aeruginosa]